MAYNAKVGSFNIDTTKTAGQTQAISGLGFQPKLVLFFWSGATDTGDGVRGGNVAMGFGAMTGASNRWSTGYFSRDANTTTLTRRWLLDTACIYVYIAAGLDGAADFSSFDADGFTIVIDDQFANAYRISYLALGGDDLTNVTVGTAQRHNHTGNAEVTGLGYQPQALLVSSHLAVTKEAYTESRWSLGLATASGQQGVIATDAQNNVADSRTCGYGYNGEILALATQDAVDIRDTFVSFDVDGFTINQLESAQVAWYGYVALKGGQYLVGDLTTRTDGNDISETVGFQPVAILFASANRALSTQNVTTDHARTSVGAATSASNRAAHAASDEDNLAETETATGNYDSAVYAHVADDAIVALMDIKSIDTSGFTCVMDDTEASACWVTYLAIGATEAGSNVNKSETVGTSESVTAAVSAPAASASDTVGTTDTPTAQLITEVSASETISTADTPAITVGAPAVSASDTVGEIGDTPTVTVGTPGASASDTVGTAESTSAAVGTSAINVSDTVGTAEETTAAVQEADTYAVTVSDTIGTAETVSATLADLEASASDSIMVTESVGASMEALPETLGIAITPDSVFAPGIRIYSLV